MSLFRNMPFRALFVATSLFLGGSAVENAAAADLSGYWHGHWQSDVTGHRGPLRCQLTRVDDTSYRADFSGRFFKIIPFRYSVILNIASDGDTVTLTGENDLGRRYGTFHYTAYATADEFNAVYTSCKDDGQFVLTRCGCSCR